MNITVESVRCKDLAPGDLFSTVGDDYWNGRRDKLAVGERVYIRTEAPCPADQAEEQIFRVTVAGPQTPLDGREAAHPQGDPK